MKRPNYTMLCDYYELTMANGYFENGMSDRISYFDMFFRNIPDGGGFAIAAGLEQLCEYIENLKFTEKDIRFLRSKKIFSEKFLEYLKNFKFTGDVWSVPEGTPIFPGEPVVIVRAPAPQAQFLETFLLLTINHQTLIATKANRIVRAAQGRAVAEFGSRRAQGADAAILGARAAYIAGCAATACTQTDRDYGVPATGTMAHSWVQMFPTEYDAFKAYCEVYPDNATLLIDTYSVLKSGLPNAIKAYKEILAPRGIKKFGVRIDSGDIAYLTKKIRERFDEEGMDFAKIVVSNSLDEELIRDIIFQGAKIDSFGVGERLITAKSDPVFGGVYKLTAIEDEKGKVIPKIKISENPEKITTPSFKKVYRIFEKESGQAYADYITLHDEKPNFKKPLELFDPKAPWKRSVQEDYKAVELLRPIFKNGKRVYDLPSLEEIRKYCAEQVDLLWDTVKRFDYPHEYYVDLSQKLWDLKNDMLRNQK